MYQETRKEKKISEFGHGYSRRSNVYRSCWGKIGPMEAVFHGVEKSLDIYKKVQKSYVEKLRRGYWIVSKGNIWIYGYVFFFLFWLCGVLIAARGLSLVAASGHYSSLWCAGFSLWWLLVLWSMGSRCAGLSSCGM